jgi:predicted dehydrogenase
MKILFIGLGGIGQRHLRNIKSLYPESEFIAFRSRGSQKIISTDLKVTSEDGLEEVHSIKSFNNIDEALACKPFATIISNPSGMHVLPAIEAMKSGSNVFIEKPISSSMESVYPLLEIERQLDLTTMVGFQLRFNPLILKIKEMLSNEVIGKLMSVRAEVCEYMPWFHRYEDYRNIYASKKSLGGGVVLTQIHEIDYLINLFGMPTSVSSVGGKKSSLEIDVEDNVDILMNIKDIGVFLHMDYLQKEKKRRGVIYGEHGRIEYDLVNLELKLIRSDKTEDFEWHNFERNEMFLSEMKMFIENSKLKKPTPMNFEDGSRSLRVAEAIKKSMTEKVLVNIEKTLN